MTNAHKRLLRRERERSKRSSEIPAQRQIRLQSERMRKRGKNVKEDESLEDHVGLTKPAPEQQQDRLVNILYEQQLSMHNLTA